MFLFPITFRVVRIVCFNLHVYCGMMYDYYRSFDRNSGCFLREMMVLTIGEIIITNYYSSFDRSTARLYRTRTRSIIFFISKTVRANHDSFVSNADRAEIHEIRGPPHRCELSIVVTQLDVQYSAYRIADHWFEIDSIISHRPHISLRFQSSFHIFSATRAP